MVIQIQKLKQQLENKQKDLKVSTKKLHKHLKGDGSSAVTPEKINDEEDASQIETLVLVMSFLLAVMLGVVLGLLCVIRNGKRRRA